MQNCQVKEFKIILQMSTLGTLQILSIYKTNMLKFLDSLIELFPEESELIVIRILFDNGSVPIDDAMRKFSSRIVAIPSEGEVQQQASKKAAQMIRQKDDQFFLTDGMIFSGIGSDKVIRWKKLWQSKQLDASDREAIWAWMTLFLGLAEMYIANGSY